MVNTCTFPLCKSIVDRDGFCVSHAKYFAGAKPTKPQKEIPKRSEKLKQVYKGYKKQLTAFLENPGNKFCKIQMKGCTKVAVCVHHVSGRVGDKLTDEKDWLPSCLSCNLSVETNDKEARAKGFKKSKFNNIN